MAVLLSYDPQLRTLLRANNHTETSMNAAFKEFEANIKRNARVRITKQNYSTEDWKLLEACIEHTTDHEEPVQHEDRRGIIILVHPLYLHLTHMHRLREGLQQRQAEQYLQKMMSLLRTIKNTGKQRVVLAETAHHYAAATSLLLEQGLVGRVLFTGYDNGLLLNDEELEELAEEKVYVGGGYKHACLGHLIKELQEYVPKEELYGIRDLTLNSPLMTTNDLHVRRIPGIIPTNHLTLEETLERLGIPKTRIVTN